MGAGNTTLTSLQLDNMGMSPGGFIELAEAIALNDESALSCIELSRNKLGLEDASALARSFAFERSASPYSGLRSVRLLGCGLPAAAVTEVLTMLYENHLETLEQLGLSGNELGPDNSEMVGKIVGSAKNLEQLLLAKVNFDPDRFFRCASLSASCCVPLCFYVCFSMSASVCFLHVAPLPACLTHHLCLPLLTACSAASAHCPPCCSGLGEETVINKSSFFLREIDLSRNPCAHSGWLVHLSKIIELCGLNFEKLSINNSLGDGDDSDDAAAAEGLRAIVGSRAMRNATLNMNGNPPGPVVDVLSELMIKGKSPKFLSCSDCALGDQPMCQIFDSLRNPMCETTGIDLSHNLSYSVDVHKFNQKQSELTYDEFCDDPLSAAAEMGEMVQERNMVAFMVGELFESNESNVVKFVLAGDPDDSLAFGLQLTLSLRSLAVNRTITHLDISGNLVGDHGATALADALKVNRTITALRMDDNRVTTEGFWAIRMALFKNKKIIDYPASHNDVSNFLKLLQEAQTTATADEEAAHELVHKACSGGQVNLPLKERGIQQIRTAKEILRKVRRDSEKVKRIACEIEDAVIENQERAEERLRERELERENATLNKRRDAWWWEAREVRERRDESRQENFEISLMYKMWSRRGKLKQKWSERCASSCPNNQLRIV